MHLGNGGKYISACHTRNIQCIPKHTYSTWSLFCSISKSATHVQSTYISSACFFFFFALLHSSAFFIELNWTEHSGLQLRECCDGVVMSCYPHSMCICMSRCTGAHAHSRNLCCEWQERAGRIVSILHFELFMQNKCIQIPRHVFSLIKERLWLHVGQSLWTVMSHSMTVRPHHQPSQP